MLKDNVFKYQIRKLNYIAEIEDKKQNFEVDFNIQEIDKFYYELNPETTLIEEGEYSFLRYIIETYLRPKERDIIKMRYGLVDKVYTYKEISKELKISIPLIVMIEKEAINNLRIFLESDLFMKKSSR